MQGRPPGKKPGLDILHLLDRLEKLAQESRRVPMTNKVAIDQNELLDLVDRMRVALPESTAEAQRQMHERQTRLRPEPLIRLAPEVRSRVEEHDLVKLAQEQAREIIADADARRREADDYARDVLARMEQQLSAAATTVRRGIEYLDKNSAESKV